MHQKTSNYSFGTEYGMVIWQNRSSHGLSGEGKTSASLTWRSEVFRADDVPVFLRVRFLQHKIDEGIEAGVALELAHKGEEFGPPD